MKQRRDATNLEFSRTAISTACSGKHWNDFSKETAVSANLQVRADPGGGFAGLISGNNQQSSNATP